MFGNWKSLTNSKPPEDELVELAHIISGIGSPERQGWVSVGRFRNGRFSIRQNNEKTVDFREPTHWRIMR